MIELYTGTPGSGKSLHCAEVIFKTLNRGKNVISNFDINLSLFNNPRKKYGLILTLDNSELSPELLIDFSIKYHKLSGSGRVIEGQTLIVIDECQILFNSRDWNAKGRLAWATFFTQHRKYGFNIILITQFDRLIDRQIRGVVEYEVIHRKVSNFKAIGFFLGLLFRGNVFIAVRRWYCIKEKIDSEFFVLRKKYASLYDSYKIFTPQAEPGPRAPARTAAGKSKAIIDVSIPVSVPEPIIKQNKIFSSKIQSEHQTEKYEDLEDFWLSAPPLN